VRYPALYLTTPNNTGRDVPCPLAPACVHGGKKEKKKKKKKKKKTREM